MTPAAAATAEQRLKELDKRNRQLEQENQVLRRADALLRSDILENDLPAGHGPLRRGHPRRADLRVLWFSKQAFFKWRANPISQRVD